MDDLIDALVLVRPYMSSYGLEYPTGCEHDALYLNVDVDKIPRDVLARLKDLSFEVDEDFAGSLTSTKFGSC